MARRWLRLSALALVTLGVVGGLTAYSLAGDPIVYYYTPSELGDTASDADKHIRLGGVVVEGSVREQGEWMRFVLTDGVTDVRVRHEGEVRGVFREGQGALVEGRVDGDGQFVSHTIMVQHDNTYESQPSADTTSESAGRAAP